MSAYGELRAELECAKAKRAQDRYGQPHPVIASAWSTAGIWAVPAEARRATMRQRCGQTRRLEVSR
jgi:hypothetical protein